MPALAPGRDTPVRNFREFRRDPLTFFTEMKNTYGDVVRLPMGFRTLTLINDPELIKDVLVTNNRKFEKSLALKRTKSILGEGLLTSEGAVHLRQRRLSQPAFHRQRVQNYGEAMTRFGSRMRERWRDGETLDIHQQMMRVTLAIAGKTLFDADVENDSSDIGEALDIFMRNFGLVFIPFSDWLEKLPFGPMRRIQRARERLDAVIFRIIVERRASGEDRGDLLSMLLRAQDEEGDHAGMTDQQLRDECVTLLLAGHETTASALSWTWMLLSQNPDAEARFHAEVDTLGGELPRVHDLPKLKFTEAVFAESMRLYPPAWAMGRQAIEDHQLAGFPLRKGAMVLCSQWVMHRDARFWPDPEKFLPDRWLSDARNGRPKFAYFPFGGGPRQCIGEAFAWMEGALMLATVAQRWRLRLESEQTVELLPVITLRPKHGMKMTLHAR
jgi:cytochrome P450